MAGMLLAAAAVLACFTLVAALADVYEQRARRRRVERLIERRRYLDNLPPKRWTP